jgi:hypothetical protein
MQLSISRDALKGAFFTLAVVGFLVVCFFCWQTYQRAYNGQAAFEYLQQQLAAQQQQQKAQMQGQTQGSPVVTATVPEPAKTTPVPPKSPAKGK